MIITKDNQKSRVHRPTYLDYIAFRIFDAEHRVIGERRFLGLFSSSAYSESVVPDTGAPAEGRGGDRALGL